MRKKYLILCGLFFFSMASTVALYGQTEVEWQVQQQIELPDKPLDVVLSVDGEWLFVLLPGQILIHSIPYGKTVKLIPVEAHFDRLTHSPRDDSFILTSSSKKALEIVQYQPVYPIDISGLPFKGPEDAPITLAVFSDYQ